jgi:hypothetical protein
MKDGKCCDEGIEWIVRGHTIEQSEATKHLWNCNFNHPELGCVNDDVWSDKENV